MDRLRFALVGAGGFGGGHLNVLRNHPRVDLKVVCDAVPEVLAPLADQGIATTTDFREALSHDDIDAAIIVLPHYLYPEAVCMALENGIHVLKEKPFAKDLADARTMMECAKSAGRILMVAGQGKYSPGFQRAGELVRSGILGDVFLSRGIITYRWSGAFTGNWRWRGVHEKSGGVAVIDSGWHILDILHWLRGMPERVYCSIGKGNALPGDYDVDDRACLVFDYPDGGIGNVICCFICQPSNRQVILHGTKATLDVTATRVAIHTGETENAEVITFAGDGGGLAPQFERFLGLIDSGAEPSEGAIEAYNIQRIIDAAYRSAKAGAPVSPE